MIRANSRISNISRSLKVLSDSLYIHDFIFMRMDFCTFCSQVTYFVQNYVQSLLSKIENIKK